MESKQVNPPDGSRTIHNFHIEYASSDLRDIALYGEMVTPDERSRVFDYTPAGLERDLATVRPSAKLPKDIVPMLKVTRELYAYAYLDYDFFRVAEQHCLLVMEAALKIALGYADGRRHREKSRATLGPLVSDARRKGLLPKRVEPHVKLLVQMRADCYRANNHPIISGAMAIVPYVRTVDVLNCIFDEHYREGPEPPALAAQLESGHEPAPQPEPARRRRSRPVTA